MSPLVLAICTAYEAGFGHGSEGRATANPYRLADLDSFEAWEYGHQQGTKRRASGSEAPRTISGQEIVEGAKLAEAAADAVTAEQMKRIADKVRVISAFHCDFGCDVPAHKPGCPFYRGRVCCHRCTPQQAMSAMMILCPDCGNKRCPKASDHDLPCTGSNEPGQPGSIY